jgi:WD40 repeat protein
MQDDGKSIATLKATTTFAEDAARDGTVDDKEQSPKEITPKETRSRGRLQGRKSVKQKEWTPWKDRIRSHKDAVIFVTAYLAPDRQGGNGYRCLLSASADGTVRVFELSRSGSQPQIQKKLQLQAPIEGRKNVGLLGRPAAVGHGGLTAFAMPGVDGLPILYGSYESGHIAAWSLLAGQPHPERPDREVCSTLVDLDGHSAPVTSMQCCCRGADGSSSARPWLVSASLDGTIRVWRGVEAPLSRTQQNKPKDTEVFEEVETKSSPEDVDDEAGRCLFILDFGTRNPVSCFALLSCDLLVAGSWDGRLRILNLRSRSCSNIVEVGRQMKVTCLCAPPSPSGESADDVYVGLEDGTIANWKLSHTAGESSYEVLSWKGHAAAATKLELTSYSGKFSDDTKRWLVSSSEDGTICIWSPNDGKLLKEFFGHTGGVLMLCYAPQERLLWSGSRDHTIRSWCLEEAETQLRELEAMEQADGESRKAVIIYAKAKQDTKSKKKAGKAGASSTPRGKSPKQKGRTGSPSSGKKKKEKKT